MDIIYLNGGSTFERSLAMLVGVISQPSASRAVVD
jgi:hypothetical protein